MKLFLKLLNTIFVIPLCFNLSLFAQRYDSISTLGDSLLDGGTYAAFTQLFVPKSGRFTVNPGKTSGEDIAKCLNLPDSINASGLNFTTQNILGGNNYAQGGARVSTVSTILNVIVPKPINLQLAQLLKDTNGRISKKSLVLLTGGANDVLSEYENNWLQGNQAAAISNLQTAGTDLAKIAAQLEGLCPKTVVVFKNADIVLTPLGQTNIPAFTQMGSAFNKGLDNGLSHLNTLVIDPNLIKQVISEPTRFGFLNVNQLQDYALLHANFPISLPFQNSIFLVEGVNIIGGNNYVYADTVHPSAALHQIIADTVLSIIRAPEQISALSIVPMTTMRQYLENMETRLDNLVNTECGIRNRCAKNFEIYCNFMHEQTKFNRCDFIGNKTKSNTGILGVDYMLTDNFLIGVEANFTSGRTNYYQNSGNFHDRIFTGLGYLALKLPRNFNINAFGGGGKIKFNCINRNAFVGNNIPVFATGKTSGNYITGKAALGYSFLKCSFNNNLSLGFSYEKVKVKGYSEEGDFIKLNFNNSEYKALRLSVAWDLYYENCTNLNPYLRISLEHDLKKAPICIKYGMQKTLQTKVKIERPGRTYANFNTGFNYVINNNFSINFDGNVHAGQKNIKSWSLNTGLNVIF